MIQFGLVLALTLCSPLFNVYNSKSHAILTVTKRLKMLFLRTISLSLALLPKNEFFVWSEQKTQKFRYFFFSFVEFSTAFMNHFP